MNRFSNVLGIIKQGVQVVPVSAPAFPHLRILIIPAQKIVRKHKIISMTYNLQLHANSRELYVRKTKSPGGRTAVVVPEGYFQR